MPLCPRLAQPFVSEGSAARGKLWAMVTAPSPWIWGCGGGWLGRRGGPPGPHAHGNAARQVVDGLRTEVWGEQKQSNDPRNEQHNPNTPTTGRR